MDVAVGFLLQNLKDFVTSSVDLIAGVEENVDLLIKELEGLEEFLVQCREASNDDEFLDQLAKDVRKLVYRAEDAIYSYIVAASVQKRRSTIRVAIHAFDHAIELRNLAKELESIKQEVREINTTKVNFGSTVSVDIRSEYAREPLQKLRKPVIDDDDDNMVGFEDARNDIIRLIDEGPDDLEIISIVGMLGLGKTTLARSVFRHPTVEYRFSARAFVEVCAEYSAKEVFLKILRCIVSVTREMNSMSTDDLAQEIRKHLENTNFLIVLDDVWAKEAWDDIKIALPNNPKHSRVLITTRQRSVAQYVSKGFEPYDLRFLTVDESLELLRHRVFGKEGLFPSDLAPYEALVLDKCDGLPLAIVVIAGILIKHPTDCYFWEKVVKDLDIYNLASSRAVSYVIDLSFESLPDYLRACFLYLGVFHVGTEISSKTLLQLWFSEGFVVPVNGQTNLEEIVEDYLEELVARSLVMVEKRGLGGRIKTVRIQNTLREFCKAQAKKEELFQEIEKFEYGNISLYGRRLSINPNVLEYIRSKPSAKCVRSLLCFTKEDCVVPPELFSVIPKSFKLVRVLDIRSIVLTRFPMDLYYLFLLKYIAMSSKLKVIPEKMSNLRYLQTLIFQTTERSVEIEADIWKMAHLMHLETNASSSLRKPKEASSANPKLQTLSEISPESCCREVFDRAPRLKKLGIRGTLGSNLEALLSCLSSLKYLENLKLLNNEPATVRSPPSNCLFPANLTKLTLQNTKFDWGFMSTLARLEKLKVLKLKDNAFSGSHWDAKSHGFPALRALHIVSTDLVTWEASALYFPKLSQLHLEDCSKLEGIPSDLVNISALQLVYIRFCNPLVATFARKLQSEAQYKEDKVTTGLKIYVYPPDY